MADTGSDSSHEEPVATKQVPDIGEQPSSRTDWTTETTSKDLSINNNSHNGGITSAEKNSNNTHEPTTSKGKEDPNDVTQAMGASPAGPDGEAASSKDRKIGCGNSTTHMEAGAEGRSDAMDTGAGGQGVLQVAPAGGGPQVPVLTLKEGVRKMRNDRYPINHSGMVVVVRNTVFAYPYEEVETEDKKMSTGGLRSGRARGDDVFSSDGESDKVGNELKRLFNIKDGDLFVTESLTAVGKEDTDPIVALINKLSERVRKKRPSFLLFVLLSAGMKHGQFLLHSDSQTPCCEKETGHKLLKNCRGRRVSDLVRRIQEAEDGVFSNIPKIVLIQTISGTPRSASYDKGGSGSKPPPPKTLDPDDFIPRGSDTFVYYVHTEDVASCGFYMVEQFLEAIKHLQQKIAHCNGILRKIDGKWGKGKSSDKRDAVGRGESLDKQLLQTVNKALKVERIVQNLELEGEGLVEGWFDDLMTTVSARIFNSLKLKHKGKKMSHMRAHISSTLRKRISMIDMLKQQK